MGEDASTGRPAVTDPQAPEQIEREIERTRSELGDTVEALARKTDVKAQAKQKLEETKATVSEKLGKAKDASPDSAVAAASQATQKTRENPIPLALAGAFAAGFLAGRAFRR